jgi:hypothetical protein
MKQKVTQITLFPDGEPISSQLGYAINLCDDNGIYLEVTDKHDSYDTICIHPEDWPALREAINKMVKNCMIESVTNSI